MNLVALSLGVLTALTISHSVIAQDNEKCNIDQWTCKSGQCIELDEQCDGEVNCNDGSDETSEACLYSRCAPFAFRCSYGGCVSGDAECNGHKDCADGSDELDNLCIKTTTRFDDGESFYCTSGEVIAADESCDGKKDCRDGSDETLANCVNNECPPFSFRCAYGACIVGSAECDGVSDCADGSDEILANCESKRRPGTDTPPHTGRPTEPVKPVVGCVVPNVRKLIVSPPFNDKMKIPPGEVIESFGTVLYSCERGHALFGVKSNVCSVDTWLERHPKCLRYCSSRPLKDITISAKCEERETSTEISCAGVLRAGARARISCASGYVRPGAFQDIIKCGDDGTWDYTPGRCIAECGREYDPGQKFIAGGDTINNTLVPWNVGIYQLVQGRYTPICGGSIINAKIVVSAAHCFWDDSIESRRTDFSIYAVAAGKYYRDYYATESLSTQFFNVSEIAIPRGYQDAHLNYIDDIAVLVLNKFISFREHIRPICVDWNLYKLSQREVPAEIGRVAGWGRIGPMAASSPELRSIDLQAVTFDQCGRELPPHKQRLLTGDKFCAGGEPDLNVCRGDSGAGFAIPKMVNGIRMYYLWGVVSNGLTDQQDCSGTFYTAFTNVQHHRTLIEEYETKYRP